MGEKRGCGIKECSKGRVGKAGKLSTERSRVGGARLSSSN